jgi:hypothetical protein
MRAPLPPRSRRRADGQAGGSVSDEGGLAAAPLQPILPGMTHLLVAMMTAAALSPGSKAPQFTLESTSGKKVSLSDFQGRTVVLAFYSKAFTGG